MSRSSGYESRQGHYRHLTRPDGSLLSEKDCLLLDLCIQWTKNASIATSTYFYLLNEKFIRQTHQRTVKRTFENISLYIKGVFKNIHIINGVIHKDKIRIERTTDFDLKMEEATQKNQEKLGKKGIQECRPSLTKMSTIPDKNVNPSTYIYKTTKKTTIESDLADLSAHTYTHEVLPQDLQDQFKNDVSLQEAEVEIEVITETQETTDNFQTLTVGDTNYYHPVQKEAAPEGLDLKGLAMKYFSSLAPKTEDNTEVEDIKPVITETATGNSIKEAVIATTSSTDSPSSTPQESTWMTREELTRRVKEQSALLPKYVPEKVIIQGSSNVIFKNKYLKDFWLNQEIFDSTRKLSNKPHFSNDRIIAVVQNIVANNPETVIFGGKTALIKYLVKALNNEKEYTMEEIGESIADRERQLAEEGLYQFNNRIILYGN